jgi:hypothetical protein
MNFRHTSELGPGCSICHAAPPGGFALCTAEVAVPNGLGDLIKGVVESRICQECAETAGSLVGCSSRAEVEALKGRGSAAEEEASCAALEARTAAESFRLGISS